MRGADDRFKVTSGPAAPDAGMARVDGGLGVPDAWTAVVMSWTAEATGRWGAGWDREQRDETHTLCRNTDRCCTDSLPPGKEKKPRCTRGFSRLHPTFRIADGDGRTANSFGVDGLCYERLNESNEGQKLDSFSGGIGNGNLSLRRTISDRRTQTLRSPPPN